MIFLSFVNLGVVQKSEQVKLRIRVNIYELSSDDKILSSLIKKA